MWLDDFLKRVADLKARAMGAKPKPIPAKPIAPVAPKPTTITASVPVAPAPKPVAASTNGARWKVFKIRPENLGSLKLAATRMNAARPRIIAFLAANPVLARVPWWACAIMQEREASGNYNRHAHNGDPLSGITKNVPKNRPPGWMALAPSERTWERSALDAYVAVDKLHQKDWSTPDGALDAFERFNGLGYRNRGVPSAYLWSMTDQYTKGGYPRDGVWDSNYVSKQAGCAALMDLAGAFPR